MRKIIQSSAWSVALGAVLGLSHVQAAEFAGWEAGVGVGQQSNSVNYQGFLAGRESAADDQASFLFVRYGWASESPWVMGLGLRYDLQKINYGSTHYPNRNESVTAKFRTGFSVAFEPGYIVQPNWMVYGKWVLNRARGEFIDTGAPSGKTRHDGYGLGFGVATEFSERWVGRVELTQVNYSRELGNQSTGKPRSREANLSVGYRF